MTIFTSSMQRGRSFRPGTMGDTPVADPLDGPNDVLGRANGWV